MMAVVCLLRSYFVLFKWSNCGIGEANWTVVAVHMWMESGKKIFPWGTLSSGVCDFTLLRLQFLCFALRCNFYFEEEM
jgi:hypothetical protein